jgi:hypothetical protein
MAIVPSESPLDIPVPKPREFLTTDFVHPDNSRIIAEEHRRYGLLTWLERWRMRRRVNRLRGQLRDYNRLVAERNQIIQEAQALKARFEAETDPAIKERLAASGRSVMIRGRAVRDELAKLEPLHSDYTHFSGWLEYERQNRADLKARAKEEQAIRRAMRKEGKDIARIVKREWARTAGCHYLKVDANGREKAITPKIFKIITAPDAHYLLIKTRTKTLVGYREALPYKVDVYTLCDEMRILTNVKGALNRDTAALWSQQGQFMYRVSRLDSPDALPRLVFWRDTWEFYPEDKNDLCPFCAGVAEKRKMLYLNLEDDPHVLVGGKSKSGKSNLINGMIATIVQTHSPAEVRLVMIDQKGGVEFTHWKDAPHLLWNVGKTVEDVKPLLSRVVNVMRKRLELLEKARKKDFLSYNRTAEKKLPRIIVFLDEMNTLINLGTLTTEIHDLIMLITSQGRAAGVHLVAATQYPSVEVVPGRVKANMGVRISFYMPSRAASQVILDSDDASHLPNVKGRAIVDNGGHENTKVQAPRILESDIEHVVSKAKRLYPETSDDLDELADVPRAKVWNEEDVLEASIEWVNGSLSGQRLHKMLGDESPGERHFNTMCKRIIDQATANGGYVMYKGARYDLKKSTTGKCLVRRELDKSDELDGLGVGVSAVPSVELASSSPEGQPLESAAD